MFSEGQLLCPPLLYWANKIYAVKSENDRLSDTQRLWIHILSGAGVKVELCSAIAKK